MNDVIESVEPHAIRAEPNNFQELIIRQLDRIAVLSQNVLRSFDRKAILALEGSIQVLASLLAPYVNEDYKEKLEQIGLQRELIINKNFRFEYFLQLMKWLELIVLQFGRVGILPAERIDIDFGGVDDGLRSGDSSMDKDATN